MLEYLKDVLQNMPEDWLRLTTHRLDIYNEELAKVEFTQQFESLYQAGNADTSALAALPTAYDYVRLGHPLSCVLEWAIAKRISLLPENVISFSSHTIPILAILRSSLLKGENTLLAYKELPDSFDAKTIRQVYGYDFEIQQVRNIEEVKAFEGITVFISQQNEIDTAELDPNVNFLISNHPELGSILLVNGHQNAAYISEIQHVRRRETIAMTPANCFSALQALTGVPVDHQPEKELKHNKAEVVQTIRAITGTRTKAVMGSSGLSVQYAIMMGLLEDARTHHPGKAVRFIIPPNCYGGTNDQARRVAACHDYVDIVDLPVDRDHDMVESTNLVLEQVAVQDAVPYIIVEIPTNPRVEVPNLDNLRNALITKRQTTTGKMATEPVFIIDQTFCPNVQFLKKDGIFRDIKTLSYVSGSKFPSGGKCTAGYCVANDEAASLMDPIAKHLKICDNEATDLQVQILAQQMPSMNQRISDAYKNTRAFIKFIKKTLPSAKINFVPDELAEEGITPSVFSLDLPTKGETEVEREAYKRALNLKLINMMITKIPDDSKYCVSYGQLKGCYWTIPATSTQGTTKEADKDYIARVSVAPDLDLERHKVVFEEFVNSME